MAEAKMSKINLLLALLLLILYVDAQTIENDTLVRILREEIKYNMESYHDEEVDRKSTRLNSSHSAKSRMPSSA